MINFAFAPDSPIVGTVGGCAIDGAGAVFIPCHCNGGEDFELWKFVKGVGFTRIERVNMSVFGKFGPSSCVVIGSDVLCLLSVRDATGKQRLAKGWVPGVATPPQDAGALTARQSAALGKLITFLGL